jgi:hypothetical protein
LQLGLNAGSAELKNTLGCVMTGLCSLLQVSAEPEPKCLLLGSGRERNRAVGQMSQVMLISFDERCDAQTLFVFVSVNEKGKAGEAVRVPHERQLHREFLARLPAHSTIVIKATGHYSWLVDEMEQLGHYPKRANPLEAKRGLTNNTELRGHSQAP